MIKTTIVMLALIFSGVTSVAHADLVWNLDQPIKIDESVNLLGSFGGTKLTLGDNTLLTTDKLNLKMDQITGLEGEVDDLTKKVKSLASNSPVENNSHPSFNTFFDTSQNVIKVKGSETCPDESKMFNISDGNVIYDGNIGGGIFVPIFKGYNLDAIFVPYNPTESCAYNKIIIDIPQEFQVPTVIDQTEDEFWIYQTIRIPK